MQRIPWHHTTQKLAIGRYTDGTLALFLIRWVLQTQLVSSALPMLNSSEVGDHQHSEKKSTIILLHVLQCQEFWTMYVDNGPYHPLHYVRV